MCEVTARVAVALKSSVEETAQTREAVALLNDQAGSQGWLQLMIQDVIYMDIIGYLWPYMWYIGVQFRILKFPCHQGDVATPWVQGPGRRR